MMVLLDSEADQVDQSTLIKMILFVDGDRHGDGYITIIVVNVTT